MGKEFISYNFEGKRYDIGNKVGLLKANIELDLKMKKQEKKLLKYLKTET